MTILTGPVTLGDFPRSPASSISASSVPGKESIFTKKRMNKLQSDIAYWLCDMQAYYEKDSKVTELVVEKAQCL